VVSIAERVQAVPMAFTQAVLMQERSCILRGLQPAEDRIVLAPRQAAGAQMHPLLAGLGNLVAWGQLRSAGRAGSANADELMAFANKQKWRARWLDVAHACAEQTRLDAALFNAAFDDHAFAV
jgi:hypothetical protein